MRIEELPLNDEAGQYFYKMYINSFDEYAERRREEMENCDHLFVKLKEGESSVGFHSSDYYYDPAHVECVHCGMTNRFMPFEEMDNRGRYHPKKTIETQVFEKTFRGSYLRGGKSFDESSFHLISPEILPSYHPGLLYQMALQINPEGTNEELFEIMKQLHTLETRQEILRLKTLDQTEDLIKRYKSKVLK